MKRPHPDGLITLRGVYLCFVFAIVSIGVVVAILEATGGHLGSTAEGPAAIVVVTIGVAGLAAPRFVRRRLPCDSELSLATGYRQRFFLEIAFAEVAALAGFTGFMVSSAGWLYPLGTLFSAIGFVRLAPTARHLGEDQDELRGSGCALSLMSALRKVPGHP